MASAASFSKDGKGTVIHVGFKLDTNHDGLKALFPHTKFIEQPIVAVMYKEDENEMRMWYNRFADKKITAFVRGYFYKPNAVIVLHLTIDGKHYWITVMNKANIKPFNVKHKIAAREFGDEVPLDRFEMNATAYYFTV